ncbi:MAG: tripartite tricarboxylate transporter TctB family protein [Spirochaetales bacterium]|nr:tripartite tricarboxylate transporter TctB family protein [Spirochaetales bacterium]
MAKKELIFTLLLILMGVASLLYSISLPTRGNIALSPGLFPGVVSLLLILLSTYYLISSLVHSQKKKKLTEVEQDEENNQRSLPLTLALFIGYLILLYYIHFIASTLIFLLAAMIFLYRRFYWKIPIISITAVFTIFYLFRYLLNVRLP